MFWDIVYFPENFWKYECKEKLREMNASKTDPLDLKEYPRGCVNFFCP